MHDVRDEDAAGGELLRVRGVREHERLQLNNIGAEARLVFGRLRPTCRAGAWRDLVVDAVVAVGWPYVSFVNRPTVRVDEG